MPKRGRDDTVRAILNGSRVTARTAIRVFASMAAFRDHRLVEKSVLNAITFLDPERLALHTSAGSAVAATLPSLVHHPRILHNRRHVHVQRNSQAVLFIHLSNMELLFSLSGAGRPRGSDRVVLVPGNAIFFAPCHPLLIAAPMSFGLEYSTDVFWRDESLVRSNLNLTSADVFNAPMPRWQMGAYSNDSSLCSAQLARGHGKPVGVGPMAWGNAMPMPPTDEALRRLARGDDSVQRMVNACVNTWFRAFFQWASSDTSTWPWKPTPLAISIHEGSWYTAELIEALLLAVHGTALSSANLSRACPWKDDARICGSCKCTLEESILPTFAWQKFPQLAQLAKPPLVARFLGTPGDEECDVLNCTESCRARPTSLTSAVQYLRRHSDVWCGLKLAHDSGDKFALRIHDSIQLHGEVCGTED